MWIGKDSGEEDDGAVKREWGIEELLGKAHCCFLSQICFPTSEEEQSSSEGTHFLPALEYKGVEASEGAIGAEVLPCSLWN